MPWIPGFGAEGGLPMALLQVQGLRASFSTPLGEARAVDDVSFQVGDGEVVGLVGESGCGKTVTALSVLGLLPAPAGRVLPGSSIRFEGEELVGLPERRLRQIRGNRIAMIFQEPMTSLNPVLPVGEQVSEVIRAHGRVGRKEARARAEALLGEVGFPDPPGRYGQYPHQLSGGMRQRVMLASALACEPDLLIADEPTTALDVTTQAELLARLLEIRTRRGMSILLITHDLGVVAESCDRVLVMYAGQVVEAAPVQDLFLAPRHPYTRALLDSLSRLGDPRRLTPIPGIVPEADEWPSGCRFAPRCPHAWDRCHACAPPLGGVGEDGTRVSRCWLEVEAS
jgi:peptide/nickel transport system ATP-binding protein